MPQYVAPARQFRVLPRRVPAAGAIGAASLLYELYRYFEEEPPGLEPLPEPQVIAEPAPGIYRNRRITRIAVDLVKPPASIIARKPQVVNVPPPWIAPVTQEVIERGPEYRFSAAASLQARSVMASLRSGSHDGTKKRRIDGKGQSHAQYVAGLRMVHRTYGRASEVMDLYEAIFWNVYLGGRSVASGGSGDDLQVDWTGVVSDLFMNEVVDRSVGYAKRRELKRFREMGGRTLQLPSTTIGHIGRMF